jgi:L-ascorbate metabolism protein UlaG (beta-lactamase superfamily)
LIKPFLADDLLLADIRAAAAHPGTFHLWWMGQSGFLVQWQGRHLLLDPYLSDSLTRKYAETDKPHRRMTELVVDPARLDFVDVVTSSHSHTDHLDADTLLPLRQASPELQIVVPAAVRQLAAQRLQLPPERLVPIDAGEQINIAGFQLNAVPSAHETVECDDQGRCLFLGYVVCFGAWVLYHSGDTVLYDGMVTTLRRWPIDLALLPINGRAPERRVAGNLWGGEAARLSHDIGATTVIPCHYDMFDFNTATPDEFIHECQRLGQKYVVLQVGQRWTWPG